MIFFESLEKYGNNTAVITENKVHVSYRDMLFCADGLVSDIPSRSLIFIVCQNSYLSICAYVGCLRKKIVPVLIMNGIETELFDNLKETYRPSHIIRFDDSQAIVDATGFEKDFKVHDDLALLLTTSGSTGSPKLVRQSYENIESNAKSISQYLKISENDRPITTMPMSYTYGLSIINSHLLMGASIVVTEKTLMDKEFWSLLKESEATTFGGVPYIYEMLKRLRFERMDLPNLKILTQAGGKLSPELSFEFADICSKKGMEFIVMYGQTEATARMSYLPFEFAISKAGSMGIAIPGGEFSLIDTNGAVITGSDVVGELVYKGNNVTLGYAENRFDLEKGDERGGILETGDMAKRDADGFHYIVGRKKRFLKLFGSRVNLDEVDALLQKEGFTAVCSGKDDHLKIYITDANSQNAVDDFIKNRTGINNKGFSIHVIDEIPRNEAGKVLYSKLD